MSKVIKELKASHRLILSGTPIQVGYSITSFAQVWAREPSGLVFLPVLV